MKQKHSRSLLCNEEICFKTYSTVALDRHHIFGGPMRDKSEKYGLWVYLRHDVHMWLHSTREGQKYSEELKKKAQKEFERMYGRARFMEIFKRNYL